jgi:hypothetical protein
MGAIAIVRRGSSDQPVAGGEPTPVLVELFTSEGCSSCPPVDKLVADLQRKQPIARARVVLLSFHVDYWDELGWHDRFSSHDFTKRQEDYATKFAQPSVYTPEVIVDGRESRPESLADDITRAGQTASTLTLTVAPKSAHAVRITAHGNANDGARILAAITEDGLSTKVGSGENGGHTLQHSGVVRQFTTLGKLQHGELAKDFTIALDPQWQTSKLRLVVFGQDDASGRVLGVTAVPVSDLLK